MSHIRSTIISPGAVATGLTESITEPDVAKSIADFYAQYALPGGCVRQHRGLHHQPARVGAAVRLRSNSEVTGVVLGDGFEPDRLRVRWDDTDEVTDCIAAKLEPAQ